MLLEIVVVILVVYSVAMYVLDYYEKLPDWYSVSGPLALIRSQFGIASIRKITDASPKFWKAWGTAGVVLSLVGLVVSLALVGFSALTRLTQPASDVVFEQPRNFLVIPGVNDFLPLSAAPEIVLALFITLVIHEGGHAILCRVGNIDIDSTGLVLLSIIPVGAFVEPDEDSQEDAVIPDRLRMFAAGVMNNIVSSIIAIFILAALAMTIISVAPGAPVGGVLPDGPADQAQITEGDRITHINGAQVNDSSELFSTLENSSQNVTMTVNGEENVRVNRDVIVSSSAGINGLQTGDKIRAIDGMPIGTSREFEERIENTSDYTATLTLKNGTQRDLYIGALVVVQPGSSLSKKFPTEEALVMLELEGQRIKDREDAVQQLSSYDGGKSPEFVFANPRTGEILNGSVSTKSGSFGAQISNGAGGIQTIDLGLRFYPAEQYLNLLKIQEPADFGTVILSVLTLPVAGVVTGTGFNFAGFTPQLQQYYTVALPLGGNVVFFVASVLFWSAWIGINVALFNMLPTFALDGGRIIRDTVRYILGDGQKTEYSVYIIKGATLTLILTLVFIPVL